MRLPAVPDSRGRNHTKVFTANFLFQPPEKTTITNHGGATSPPSKTTLPPPIQAVRRRLIISMPNPPAAINPSAAGSGTVCNSRFWTVAFMLEDKLVFWTKAT